MKKVLIILSIVCLTCGCSSNFLEIYPETVLNEGNFYQTEKQYLLLANGCYVPLRNYGKSYWGIAEVPSDNSSYQFNPVTDENFRTWGSIDVFLAESDNTVFQDFWSQSYQGIYRCNKVIQEIEKSTINWTNESLKNRSLGEASFLRGLYYFNLVRPFGGVPLALEPVAARDAVAIKRASVQDVYAQIITDLRNAKSYFERTQNVEEKGRANWGAATSLLGKVYLTLKQYNDAEVELKSVISSGKYSLRNNYADVFNPVNKDYTETIFAIQYSENTNELAQQFIFRTVPNNSGGEITGRPGQPVIISGGTCQPTQDLIDAFEPGDLRKGVSIKFWVSPSGQTIPYFWKFKPPVSAPNWRCGDNLPLLRYSDVLLMCAEALNEQGKLSEAIPYVQQVRNRAGLTNILSGYDMNSLAKLIAKERQVEFCFENQRWYDLLRTGKAIEVMTAHGQIEKALRPYYPSGGYQMDPTKLLFPIPAQEVIINKLEPNPGY